MPFVDPQTIHNPTPLQPVSSAWGDQVRDDIVWLAGDGSTANPKPMCRVMMVGATAVAHATWTAISPITSESFDVGGMHSTSANSSRITIPTGGAGVYQITACLEWASSGGTVRGIQLRKNGSVNLTGNGLVPQLPGLAFGHTVTTLVKLAAGDYVEIMGYQDSGSASNINVAEFSAHWVGVG